MAETVTYARLKWRGGVDRFALNYGSTNVRIDLAMLGQLSSTWEVLHDRARDVLERLQTSAWGADDVVITIGVGLQGGGGFVKPSQRALLLGPGGRFWPEVQKALDEHVLARPLAESAPLAACILMAAIYGLDPRLADVGLDVDTVFARSIVADADVADADVADAEAA